MTDRTTAKTHYTVEFTERLKDSHVLTDVIDGAYCMGYNTVLEAAENVLSKDDYWKIVNYLNEHGI